MDLLNEAQRLTEEKKYKEASEKYQQAIGLTANNEARKSLAFLAKYYARQAQRPSEPMLKAPSTRAVRYQLEQIPQSARRPNGTIHGGEGALPGVEHVPKPCEDLATIGGLQTESFYVVPTHKTSTKTIEEYALENAQLKKMIDQLSLKSSHTRGIRPSTRRA